MFPERVIYILFFHLLIRKLLKLKLQRKWGFILASVEKHFTYAILTKFARKTYLLYAKDYI